MNLQDAIYGRRSIREYTDEPVSKEAIAVLINAAIQAPSAVNEQPWSFTVIRDRTLLDRISGSAKSHLLNTSSIGMAASRFRDQLANPNFNIFYHAPALVVISAMSDGPWAIENCTLAAQNLMLTAFSMGLGSCWIGFAEHWLQTGDGKAMLQLPNHYLPVAPIIVGYPRATPNPLERRSAPIRWIG